MLIKDIYQAKHSRGVVPLVPFRAIIRPERQAVSLPMKRLRHPNREQYESQMAIDFMIMPISRYITGDFITPNMRFSWDQGIPYSILGPDGKKDFPKDTPFGGPGGPKHRAKIFDMLATDLGQLPTPIPDRLWDERSAVEPRFHRVDPAGYQVLLDEAAKAKKSFLGLPRKAGTTTHLTASLFLPCAFDTPFGMSSPLERPTGSTVRALEELAASQWPEGASNAVCTLREALTEATELKLPMIVDF